MGVRMNQVAVVIETARHHICGNVAVPAVSRLSDYANDPQRRFWAVTDVEITMQDGGDRVRSVPFMLVAAHEIYTISPVAAEAPRAARPAEPPGYAPADDPLAAAVLGK